MTGETNRPAPSPGGMLGDAVALRDWSPRTVHTQCLAHAWGRKNCYHMGYGLT